MTDKLREAIAEQISEGLGATLRKFCDSPEAKQARHYLHAMPKSDWNTLIGMLTEESASAARAALAAAPQPAHIVAVKPLQWVDRPDMTDPITGEVVEAYALAGDYHYLAEAVGCSLATAKRRADRKHQEFILSQIEAAPQPAPMDREALVEVIDDAIEAWMASASGSEPEHVADALLARGLRLPGGEETMAWAVVEQDNQPLLKDGYSAVAVGPRPGTWLVRVVEGGDDEH